MRLAMTYHALGLNVAIVRSNFRNAAMPHHPYYVSYYPSIPCVTQSGQFVANEQNRVWSFDQRKLRDEVYFI